MYLFHISPKMVKYVSPHLCNHNSDSKKKDCNLRRLLIFLHCYWDDDTHSLNTTVSCYILKGDDAVFATKNCVMTAMTQLVKGHSINALRSAFIMVFKK